MCIFDELATSQMSANHMSEQFEVQFLTHEVSLDSSSSAVSSRKSSSEATRDPPSYESSALPTAPRTKSSLFSKIFSRNSKKSSTKQELPSYRDTEVAEAWAKVGIDVNDRKQGPRPQCTPEELVDAMDGLFGAPTKKRAPREAHVHSFTGLQGF